MTEFDPKPTPRKATKDPKTVGKKQPQSNESWEVLPEGATSEEIVAAATDTDKKASKKDDKPKRNYGVVEIVNKQCRICMSPDRYEIEKLIAYGMSQREVLRQFEQLGQKFNKNSMSNHVRKHMTLRKAVVRRIVEQQAAKQFENIEEVAGTLLTTRGILEVMRQKGAEQIIDGNTHVEPETLLKVMGQLDVLDSSEESEKLQEMMVELNCLLRAVQSTVPEGVWQQITKQFQINLDQARGRAAEPTPTPKEITS